MVDTSPIYDENKPQNDACTNEYRFKDAWKLFDARFEYAWRYFDFHAKQRMTMFNFFVVFSGFLVTACAYSIKENNDAILIGISVLGILLTYCFLRLDFRNQELVFLAEDLLRTLEEEVLFKNFKRKVAPALLGHCGGRSKQKEEGTPLGIFMRQEFEERCKKSKHTCQESEEHCRKSKHSHSFWLPLVHSLLVGTYLILVIYAICKLICH